MASPDLIEKTYGELLGFVSALPAPEQIQALKIYVELLGKKGVITPAQASEIQAVVNEVLDEPPVVNMV